MYPIGTRVKIDMNTLDKCGNRNCGWAVLSCIENYPDGVFIVKKYYEEPDYNYYREQAMVTFDPAMPKFKSKIKRFYRIEAEIKKNPLSTYYYDIREHNLISLEELRDINLNKILS